jgi:hypothetical protein
MPYLHWATSGKEFDHRTAVVRELAEKFKDPLYVRPTPEEIDAEKDKSTKLKIIRAFLHPTDDKCLHIRRTLDQYYYSTMSDADERTVSQVVYRFAKKQHNKKLEEAAKEKDRQRERRERLKLDRPPEPSFRSSQNRVTIIRQPSDTDSQEESRAKAEWDPPKVMMVNQLWLWIIDGGAFRKPSHS